MTTKYSYNYDILCSECNKPRYYGYTDMSDSEMCCCPDQNSIPTYDRRTGKEVVTKWQIKMQSIIEQVLGDGYSIEFVSETSIKVFNNNEYVLGRVTASETANHWQEQVKEIIHIIIDQNIKNAFNKLKHNDN